MDNTSLATVTVTDCMNMHTWPTLVLRAHAAFRASQILQDCTQRRELAPVELTRPVGRCLGYYGGAFSQHVRAGGIGGQHGCRPGPTGAQVMHDGHA